MVETWLTSNLPTLEKIVLSFRTDPLISSLWLRMHRQVAFRGHCWDIKIGSGSGSSDL